MAKLLVVCGPMFSEKSREVLRIIKRHEYARERVLAVKPKLDDRNFAKIATRAKNADGDFVVVEEYSAHAIETRAEFLGVFAREHPQVIVCDEAQFFRPWFYHEIHKLSQSNRKLIIVISGLDMDAWGNPFGTMPRIMAVADKVKKLKAVCFKCGSKKAIMTYKREEGTGKVQTGDAGLYEARCRECWTSPPKT